MKNISLLTISILLIFLSGTAIAQVPDTTLAKQYEEVVIKSGSYKVYKNIRKTKIQQLWKNVTDSLKKERKIAAESKAQLQKGLAEIPLLQAEIQELKAANSPIKKLGNVSNNILLWGLVVLLAAGIVFVVYRSRSSVQEVKEQIERYEELSTEFREYKNKAAEKERKLARELQNERNLVDELKAR
jgi:DNA anti-recombination protein RmuC